MEKIAVVTDTGSNLSFAQAKDLRLGGLASDRFCHVPSLRRQKAKRFVEQPSLCQRCLAECCVTP